MAKNDYFVIVGKILTFLYLRLKGETDKGIEYLSPNTEDFPISKEYFNYAIEHMYNEGLIENLNTVKTPSGKLLDLSINEGTQITPRGIAYLQDNSNIRKVLQMVPMAATIADLFV